VVIYRRVAEIVGGDSHAQHRIDDWGSDKEVEEPESRRVKSIGTKSGMRWKRGDRGPLLCPRTQKKRVILIVAAWDAKAKGIGTNEESGKGRREKKAGGKLTERVHPYLWHCCMYCCLILSVVRRGVYISTWMDKNLGCKGIAESPSAHVSTTSFDGTLVRCDGVIRSQTPRNKRTKPRRNNSRRLRGSIIYAASNVHPEQSA
jgi:hypothetical protein